jgi:hypothetical protein
MPRLKRYKKHIACFESLWDRDFHKRLTMAHIVNTLSIYHGVRHAFFTCNTEAELSYNLRLLRRRAGYGVLYLSLHGYPGHVQLDSVDLSLDDLAERMGTGFRDWVIHFGTCETVDVPRETLRKFIMRTGVAMVVGYRCSVHWIDSAASDLLLLDWLQEYRDVGAMWRQFKRTYPDLIRANKMTGLARV